MARKYKHVKVASDKPRAKARNNFSRIFRESRRDPTMRSNAYQYIFTEHLFAGDSFIWEHPTVEDYLQNQQQDQQLLDQIDEVVAKIGAIITRILTDVTPKQHSERNKITEHQSRVLQALMAGRDQSELAKELGVNQSSISKCLYGNISYDKSKYKNGKKNYGGLLIKLQRLLLQDAEFMELFEELKQLKAQL